MPQSEHELLFVAGVGRSGTTALMRVLMAHPEIVLGCERYKQLWPRRIHELTPDLFERARFFDFSDGATNLTPESSSRWHDQYADMAAKWDARRYVGDKMTRVRIQAMWQQLPDARFVCVVRDPVEVAASWEARAVNANDSWPPSYGARESIWRWNESLRRVRRAHQTRPDRILVVDYGTFFADESGASLRRVLTWLDLADSPQSSAAFDQAHRHFTDTLVDREQRLATEELAFVEANFDPIVWRDVQGLASL